MDENGIGTDATIAQHISKIQEREYVIKTQQNLFEPTPLGEALITAFQNTEDERIINLSKPHVRATMERNMSSIAEGSLQRSEFLNNCLTEMQSVFRSIKERYGDVIDNAVGGFFESTQNFNNLRELEFSKCGICEKMMELHEMVPNKKYVLICKKCKKHYNIFLKNGQISVKSPDFYCPICKFQVLLVKSRQNRQKSSFYNLCPYCYNHPSHQNISQNNNDLSQTNFAKHLKCFQCTFENCVLSNKSKPVQKCPLCPSNLLARKIKDNLHVLSCSSYPLCDYTQWLDGVAKMEVKDSDCSRCSANGKKVKTVKFNFKIGAVDASVPLFYEGCIVCDPVLKSTFAPGKRSGKKKSLRGVNKNKRGFGKKGNLMATKKRSRPNIKIRSSKKCRKCGGSGHFSNLCNKSN